MCIEPDTQSVAYALLKRLRSAYPRLFVVRASMNLLASPVVCPRCVGSDPPRRPYTCPFGLYPSIRRIPCEAVPTKSGNRMKCRSRHARLAQRLTLRELADRINCSVSFLSKVENDHIKPSFAMLHRLVRALDINVASLFSEDQNDAGPVSVFQEGSRPVIQLDSRGQKGGVKLERLVPAALSPLLEANIHEVAPGAGSRGFISHRGEEMGYILQGQLELTVDKKSVLLKTGDVFFFSSERPHGYVNPGKIVTRVLWVNTPPSF